MIQNLITWTSTCLHVSVQWSSCKVLQWLPILWEQFCPPSLGSQLGSSLVLLQSGFCQAPKFCPHPKRCWTTTPSIYPPTLGWWKEKEMFYWFCYGEQEKCSFSTTAEWLKHLPNSRRAEPFLMHWSHCIPISDRFLNHCASPGSRREAITKWATVQSEMQQGEEKGRLAKWQQHTSGEGKMIIEKKETEDANSAFFSTGRHNTEQLSKFKILTRKLKSQERTETDVNRLLVFLRNFLIKQRAVCVSSHSCKSNA